MSLSPIPYRHRFFSGHAWRQGWRFGGWFRFWGYGLGISTMPPLFSERIGLAKNTVRICGIKFVLLVPGQ